MRVMASALLIAILNVAGIESPVMAAPAVGPSVPLGVVLVAKNAHDGPDLIYGGATLYDGDRLNATEDGTLLARLGSGQMILQGRSSAIVHSAPHGFSAELESGSVAVSSGEGQSFQVLVDGATIRPLNARSASAQIVKMSPKELTVTSTRGALEVRIGEEVKIIEAGASYRVEAEAAESDARPQSSTTQGAGRSHFWRILVPGGVLITLGIIRALESGDRL